MSPTRVKGRDTRQQSSTLEIAMYHHTDASVAAARRQPESSARRTGRSFVENVQSIARMLLLSTPRASADDRQFLQDVARAEARYPMRAVERITRIAQLSTRPEHREALAEMIRAASTPAERQPVDVITASNEETLIQGAADIRVREFEQRPCRATQEAALEATTHHWARMRALIDAIRAHPIA